MKSLLQYRKTALWTCVIVFSIFVVHLAWAYIYTGGKYIGLPGGSVSVGVVSDGHTDPLNPFLYWKWQIDDTIYNLLFRSLIRYNPETEIYEWDLANCDISNLKHIECSLRNDAIWSDNTQITVEDIIKTFEAFSTKAQSSSIRKALTSVSIKQGDNNAIIIESPSVNYNLIEALSYPVLRSDVIDQLKNNRLKKESFITSWPFILEDASDNQEYNFHGIVLAKNPNYQKTVWLNKIRFKFFNDLGSLQRAVSTIEIIIPPASQENLTLGKSYKALEYRNYEFYGAFFNVDTLDKNLRAILLNNLSIRAHEALPNIANNTPVDSIFLSGATISGTKDLPMTLDKFMSEKGYKKKNLLLSEANAVSTTLESGGTIPKLKYFRNGDGASILYSDDPKWEISLFGTIPTTTTSVSINGYTLQEYFAWNPQFVYKISTAGGTLKDGKNTYELKLAQKDGTTLSETLTIYRALDKDVMTWYQQEVQNELLKELNTPEKITEREAEKQAKITKIEALEDHLYYNTNLEPYSIKLTYLSDKEAPLAYADFITKTLNQLWIFVDGNPIDAKTLDAMIKSDDKKYDIIIVGVRSPGTITDLGGAFFSSENGNPNFSNISSKNFVNLFEQLKNTTDITKANELKSEIISFMNDHNFYLPLSQPIHKIYMHLDVKWMHIPPILSNFSWLSSSLDILSKRQVYEKNLNGKNIGGFIGWIVENLSKKDNKQP